MTLLGGEQLARRPERREGPTGHLARVASPAPAIATHSGDDPPRHPRTGQGTVESLEVGIAGAGAASLVLEEAFQKMTDPQHGSPHGGRRLGVGGVEWGVEKHQAGRELFWLGHVTNIITNGGYVTRPHP